MVYFLGAEEMREVEREASKTVIDESLRGWSYNSSPVRPPYDIPLPVSVIANRYCRCGRDVYLSYVLRQAGKPPTEARTGHLYHEIISSIVEEAKRFIYNYGTAPPIELYQYLDTMGETTIQGLADKLKLPTEDSLHVRNARKLWMYMSLEISHSLNTVLSRGVGVSLDTLVSATIPFVVNYLVNGRPVGLSERLQADALGAMSLVLDLKTGPPMDFHKLTTTGYALALESSLSQPVNVGCIVYLSFRDESPTPIVIRRIHAIDESLRMEFLEERDRKQRIVAEGIDPAKPSICDPNCMYLNL